MFMVKILERKAIIRIFGLALFLSPFFNTLATLLMRVSAADRWKFQLFWKILTSGNWMDHALYGTSVIIGLLMLSGSSSVWKFVLLLLGGHIARQVFQLGENLRTHWIYGFFFLVNVMVFLFIADQLVWKQKKKPAGSTPQPLPSPSSQSPLKSTSQTQAAPAIEKSPSPAQPPAALPLSPAAKTVAVPAPQPPVSQPTARKKILIHFDGLGPWAQLLSVSNQGILVRSISNPPDQIGSREIEISVKNGLTLRTRLTRKTGPDYFFEFVHLTTREIQLLNQWLQQQAA
jgi:hypothetical protein